MAFRSPTQSPKRWPTYQPGKAYSQPVRPSQGHVYYVRLKTRFGPAYKLGFTAGGSVEERLGFQGKGHELLIDEVLYFEHWNDAYEIETELHGLLAHKQAFRGMGAHLEDMPLAGNGQSEVYLEDVLGLDWKFTPEQAKQTLENIRAFGFKQEGKSEDEIAATLKAQREALAEHEEMMKTYDWMHRAYEGLRKLFSLFHSEEKRAEIVHGRSAVRSAELIARLKQKPVRMAVTDEEIMRIKRRAILVKNARQKAAADAAARRP